jgi:hypothetical protein
MPKGDFQGDLQASWPKGHEWNAEKPILSFGSSSCFTFMLTAKSLIVPTILATWLEYILSSTLYHPKFHINTMSSIIPSLAGAYGYDESIVLPGSPSMVGQVYNHTPNIVTPSYQSISYSGQISSSYQQYPSRVSRPPKSLYRSS